MVQAPSSWRRIIASSCAAGVAPGIASSCAARAVGGIAILPPDCDAAV
jgi:hypothetical protein